MAEEYAKQETGTNQAVSRECYLLVSSLTNSSILKMEAMCSQKLRLIFNGIHGLLSQKIELFTYVTIELT
jgi:hypothetical protein